MKQAPLNNFAIEEVPVMGLRRYSIPENVNLIDYKFAVIWCCKTNVTFGAAKLSGLSKGNAHDT
jgi:hypothetical protein